MSEYNHSMVSVSTWATCTIISQKNVYIEGLLLQHNGIMIPSA